MKTANKVKAKIIADNRWIKYSNIFCNKQVQLLITNIIDILDIQIPISKLIEVEVALMNDINKNMFIKGLESLTKEISNSKFKNADWKSLGGFLFLVFQTGVFHKNKKKNIDNIYLRKDFVTLNIDKKYLFSLFSESLVFLIPEHNIYIKSILKLVK